MPDPISIRARFERVLEERDGANSPADAAQLLYGAGEYLAVVWRQLADAVVAYQATQGEPHFSAAREAEEAGIKIGQALEHANQIHYLVMGKGIC